MKKRNFYVYKYINKETRIPFYIGKGKNDRKVCHLRESKNGKQSILYDEIRRLNLKMELKIIEIQNNLTEYEAFRLESELILSIGRLDQSAGHPMKKQVFALRI